MKKRRFTSRAFLSAIVSVIFVLFLAGCGDKSEPPKGEHSDHPTAEETKSEHPEHPKAEEEQSVLEHPK